MIPLLLTSLIIMAASLVGVVTLFRGVGPFIERNLGFLVSLSAGVFLVIAWELANEAIGIAPTVGQGLVWIGASTIGIWLFFKLVPSFAHHHDEEDAGHTHTKIDARAIIFADALHNAGDGILLGTAFLVSESLGYFAAISVFVHELVQETSEFFILKQAGYSTKKALGINLLVSSTLLLGGFGSYFFASLFEPLEAILLSVAAGSVFVVVLTDLIPHSLRESSDRSHYTKHLIAFLIGTALMVGIGSLAPEPEIEEGAAPVAEAHSLQ
ncbi:MAG: ZIP family metal transporter [Patescibacteria group bacterium]